ncbi:accessory factor UbiK family protein [Halomonas pacifica]|uniref:accessory factor UbiK family protein n=1 Tax=Bisbaumannia pacifica TaxID=77098 RepID=UPI0023583CC6|nr:accessory factor UbiK family protein [Halomonas pacifica]MDC8805135.1 accessory factor UbiK family protein [Halomonas pacifica]
MINNERIGRLAQQLGERLQGASQAPEELQRSVQQVVKGAFDRLELVSREDFDILMEVLQRTRSRVEALEGQVAELERLLQARLEAEARDASPSPAAEEAGGGETQDETSPRA